MGFAENIQKYLDSEEGKQHLKKLKEKELVDERHFSTFHEKYSLNIDEIIEKLNVKYDSVEYTNKWYSRGIEPPESLYFFLFRVAEMFGEELDVHQDFCIGNYNYMGYNFQLLVGQGSIVIIKKLE